MILGVKIHLCEDDSFESDNSYNSDSEFNSENDNNKEDGEENKTNSNHNENWTTLNATIEEKTILNNNLSTTLSDEIINSPYHIFTNFFDNSVIDLIVYQTNLFAKQTIIRKSDYLSKHKFSHIHMWKDTSREEMLTYIAIIILMGILKLTKLEGI